MKSLVLFLTLFLISFNSQAQFFSGSYTSLPSFYAYDEIKIEHDNQGGKGLWGLWGGTINIKGYIDDKVEFEVSAEPVKEEDANPYIREVLGIDVVKSVYGFTVEEENGEVVMYTLLGYMDGDNNGRFIAIEQVFQNKDDQNPKMNVFFWKMNNE